MPEVSPPLIEGSGTPGQATWARNTSGVITGCWRERLWRLYISRYWLWWRLCNIGRSCSGWEKGREVWPVGGGETSGGGTAGGGAGGMSGLARVLTCFGPRKTLEASVGFTIGLASSSSRNTEFKCSPTRLDFCLISSTLKQVLLLLGCSIAQTSWMWLSSPPHSSPSFHFPCPQHTLQSAWMANP